MEEIFVNDNIRIKKEKSIYKIEFKYTAYHVINSLINTRIIRGASTDETYKIIVFNADSVKLFKEYQNYNMVENGKKNISIINASKMINTLTIQLKYLIEKESHTIIGYNPEDIIVINDEIFAFLGSELITEIDNENESLITIYSPFSVKDFFISPELRKITELPSAVHFKTSYFSLAILIIYGLLADDDFYINYLKNNNIENILHALNNHPIKNTKIYWLLSRCLVENPNERSILLF